MTTSQVIQSVAALATLALAVVAFEQIRVSRRQVEVSQDATNAAIQSAAAGRDAVQEAARARSDSRAPSVVALLERPLWPPMLDVNRHGMPYANDLRLLDPMSIQRSRQLAQGEEFVFDQDADAFLWFRCRGLLVNEGQASARVRLDGEARFIADPSPFASHRNNLAIPSAVGTYVPDSGLFSEHVLRPAQEAHFEWAAGQHTLREWADAFERPNPPNSNQALFFSVTVFDHVEDGVTDWIFIETAGRPLEPVPGRNASWRLVGERSMVSQIYPTIRHYKADRLDPPVPPWTATYTQE